MLPEQYQTHGVQGPWTDIYALCATIYKCLTGITPPDAIARVMDDKFKGPDQLDGKLSPDIKNTLERNEYFSRRKISGYRRVW